MFSRIFIGILRAWQTRHSLVAFFIHSHGKHTETAVLLDNTGSAYQIAVQAACFYLRPQITVSEYVPSIKRILHQESFRSSLLTFNSDLERALTRVYAWMAENGGKRLSHDEELKLAQEMYARI